MGVVIDHLRADCHVRVIREFRDLHGVECRTGEAGIIRRLGVDWALGEISLDWESEGRTGSLVFSLASKQGPGNGRMRDYFEVMEDAAPLPAKPGPAPRAADPPREEPVDERGPAWWREALELESAGKIQEAEARILQGVDHIGGVSSVAVMHARRMRRFLQEGDAVAARKAFSDAERWIFHYASLATSGGEGAALSRERDLLRAEWVGQLGYDPEGRPE